MIVSTGWKLEELWLGESSTHDEQYEFDVMEMDERIPASNVAYLALGGNRRSEILEQTP